MNLPLSTNRRTLLIGGGVGVGLIVAYAVWPQSLSSQLHTRDAEWAFGNFIKISRDGRVTVAVPQVETGQGIWSALPQIAADELGAAWESIAVEPAPLTDAYANDILADEQWIDGLGWLRRRRATSGGRMRVTAGSTSVRAFEQPLREAAGVARAMLISAAADRWNVDPGECETADGMVLSGGRALTFAELSEDAAQRSRPNQTEWPRPRRARLLGQPLPRLDGPAKVNGSWRFAGDVRLPDMLYASARMAPPGGKLESFAREAVRGVRGIRHISARDEWIAIVAESWWAAERAMKLADPRFSGMASAADLRPLFEDALAEVDERSWFSRGDFDAVTRGSRPLAASYYVAPAQHLDLEPLTATARFSDGVLEVWAPTQAPGLARTAASRAAGLAESEVRLFPMPVGAPGGRAMEADAVPIAVALARSLGAPVQVTMPQAVSQNHGRLSPGALARLSALPGQGGITAAWRMRVATAGGLEHAIRRLSGLTQAEEPDRRAPDGAVPPYAIPHVDLAAVEPSLPFRVGYMRGSPQREMSFFTESFVDELARAAGMEPLAFRMSMLGQSPRLARCLQAAARMAGWDGGGPGSTLGIAGCSAFGSHIGLVANASIGDQQRVRVHRLVAAVDCGRAINLGLVAQQVEAGLIWALGQATVPVAEWVAGMPRARALGTIGLPRLSDAPEVRVHVIPSGESPGGVSGLGPAVLAPAVANAIFAGTGRRLRVLPFDLAAAA